MKLRIQLLLCYRQLFMIIWGKTAPSKDISTFRFRKLVCMMMTGPWMQVDQTGRHIDWVSSVNSNASLVLRP